MENQKMWQGRFDEGMAESMKEISFSLHFDVELLREDMDGSLAHCLGLVESGVLQSEDLEKIRSAFDEIWSALARGEQLFSDEDEDIHMALERLLTERVGDLGKKLHTGRSRNDQVATDFRLYLRRRCSALGEELRKLQQTLLDLARENDSRIMPGYTHLQQAQPILFSHYLLSFFFVLQRDVERLRDLRVRLGQLPLGSGAIAGSSFPYRRESVAKGLGFDGVTDNSIDAISHRDLVIEFLSDLAILGTTLSRYAEDFVNWSSAEFGFLVLHDAFSSGSSMMPQKKNPDSMELIRGKAGRLAGSLVTLLMVTKGAPLSYSRDLQEDKEPVFDAVKTASVLLRVMEGALVSATWNFERMENKMQQELLATDLADLLVEGGMPFREAHHVVGRLVLEGVQQNIPFTELKDWKDVPYAEEIRVKLDFRFSVSRRNITGGTGPESVARQLEKATELLSESGELF